MLPYNVLLEEWDIANHIYVNGPHLIFDVHNYVANPGEAEQVLVSEHTDSLLFSSRIQFLGMPMLDILKASPLNPERCAPF